MDRRSAECIDNNGKDTNHTTHIARRVNFVGDDKRCKLHNIDWCKGGLKLADISSNNVG